ncbi:ABC transporter ATP-binding protein [Actibacterium pelagium]|uniref:ABC transporter ATP-binding protein n=1 Tax=Actibacterium pelagium TaxID=2029103 RepID=A0A917AJ92_9RHOB|nr:ABC transporter ATP-binding protein [Actibacterium pelagium]GGE55928.1 ABC transporter ATP-binding protein [Actibacterium pelagium]
MTDLVLETRGITKSFGALKASDSIDFDLRPGEIHAIIGPNGAGKSTLIKQISGELRPDAGQVFLAGTDVTQQTTRARARAGLGRTFQISELAMEDTVLQNAVLGALGASGSVWRFLKPVLSDAELVTRAEEALDRVGLLDARNQRTAELSHGQRRQLEVAVALTLRPKVFVMDEPMAGLGAEGSLTMTRFLDGLRSEAPILLVEHDMDAVFALADRISVLVYGRLIATGTVDEIRSNAEVREAYLGEDA